MRFLLLAVALVLAGCGGEAPSESAPTADAVATNRNVCLAVGQSLLAAQIPNRSQTVAFADAQRVAAEAEVAAEAVGRLEAVGTVEKDRAELAAVLNRVSEFAVDTPANWPSLRDELTAATEALLDSCAEEGDVPDFLNA